MDTKKLLPTKDFQYSSEGKEYMNTLLLSLVKKILDATKGDNILQSIESFMPEYIASGAKYDVETAIKKNKPVISIDKLLPTKDFMTKENKRDLSYLLQYIVHEVLDLATNACRDSKHKRIAKEHIEYVIRNDIELCMLFALNPPNSRSPMNTHHKNKR